MNPFVRPCVADLDAYKVEPPQYDIILNANENPWDFPQELKEELAKAMMETPLNRYPDASFTQLRQELSAYTGIDADQIIAGSGSDEVIAMICQSFVNPGDVILAHAPSFSMYEIWSAIAGASFMGIPDKEDHLPDIDLLINTAKERQAKIVYLCNPNNLYFETDKGEELYEAMKAGGILIKYFKKSKNQTSAIRLTIGSPQENQCVLDILKEVYTHES